MTGSIKMKEVSNLIVNSSLGFLKTTPIDSHKALALIVLITGLSACATAPKPEYPIYMQTVPVGDQESLSASEKPQATEKKTDELVDQDEHNHSITQENNLIETSGISTAVQEGAGTNNQSEPIDEAPPPPPPAPLITQKADYTITQNVSVVSHNLYIVAPKDTVFGLSRRFSVPVNKIFSMNGLTSDQGLAIGQKIKLPSDIKDKGVEAHANGVTPIKVKKTIEKQVVVPVQTVSTPVKPQSITKPSQAPAATSSTTQQVLSKPPLIKESNTFPNKPTLEAANDELSSNKITPNPVTVPKAPVPKPIPRVTPVGFPSASQLKALAKGRFEWPIKGKIIYPFGQLKPDVHNDGINIASVRGMDVRSSADGEVVYVGNQVKALGNTIYIRHEDGWYTGYSHLSTMLVRNKQKIRKGEVIGKIGAPSDQEPGQLHFEIRYTPGTSVARPIDPTWVLP